MIFEIIITLEFRRCNPVSILEVYLLVLYFYFIFLLKTPVIFTNRTFKNLSNKYNYRLVSVSVESAFL